MNMLERDVERHQDWLEGIENRLRAAEIEIATSKLKLALFTAVISAISSGVVTGLVAWITKHS